MRSRHMTPLRITQQTLSSTSRGSMTASTCVYPSRVCISDKSAGPLVSHRPEMHTGRCDILFIVHAKLCTAVPVQPMQRRSSTIEKRSRRRRDHSHRPPGCLEKSGPRLVTALVIWRGCKTHMAVSCAQSLVLYSVYMTPAVRRARLRVIADTDALRFRDGQWETARAHACLLVLVLMLLTTPVPPHYPCAPRSSSIPRSCPRPRRRLISTSVPCVCVGNTHTHPPSTDIYC
jgi:hypothetical protein